MHKLDLKNACVPYAVTIESRSVWTSTRRKKASAQQHVKNIHGTQSLLDHSELSPLPLSTRPTCVNSIHGNKQERLTMDFEGQKLAELIFHILIILCGAVGWVIGYIQQDFTIVFKCWLVGLVLSVLVRGRSIVQQQFLFSLQHQTLTLSLLPASQICVPDWWFYNRHPVKWLDSVPPERAASKAS